MFRQSQWLFFQLDDDSLACLLRWEKTIFGVQLTNPDDIWLF